MSIKSVLVRLTGGESDRTALDLALLAARPAAAHITALLAKRDASEALAYAVVGSGDVTAIRSFADRIVAEADAAGGRAKRDFASWIRSHGLVEADRPGSGSEITAAYQERAGVPRRLIVELGRAGDLIVLPGLFEAAAPRAELVIESALFETGRPVLVAPPTARSTFKTGVVAWNGSVESNRALAAAVPLLENCAQLFIFSQAEAHQAAADPAAAIDYLSWHGLAADWLREYRDHGSVGKNLLAASTQVGADLLVMGAYSRGRLQEIMFGTVTAHVLHHATVPVLFSH